MTTPDIENLGKAEIYDLYKMDRDARKGLGFGFFPKPYADILERYFTIGEIDVEKANAALADFHRAKEILINQKKWM